jgi:purine-cytosine permease-like protein
MGWWPSKLTVILNIVISIGYGYTNSLTTGLILSAVNGNGMSPIVGLCVSSLIAWVVATFGFKWFKSFEQYVDPFLTFPRPYIDLI